MKRIEAVEIKNNVYEILCDVARSRHSRWDIYMRGKKVATIMNAGELDRLEEENQMLKDLLDAYKETRYDIELSETAFRVIEASDGKTRRLLEAALKTLAVGASTNQIEQLQLSDYLRLRQGRWRLIYKKDESARKIYVERIALRKNSYK